MGNEILTATEVAKYLRVPKSTLYYLAIQGKLPGFKVGRHWRFKRAKLEVWMERQENGGAFRRKRGKLVIARD